MCSEFFLAIIYFFTLFIVNYFLFKLLKSYLKNILSILKFKNIFRYFKISELVIISNLYFSLKNKIKKRKLFLKVNLLSKIEKEKKLKDVVLVGNFYNFLFEFDTAAFYFLLLKKQYLIE